MENIENAEFTEFLEECVKEIFEQKAERIAVAAILPDQSVMCAYYHCGPGAKGLIASNIQIDAVFDCIFSNRDKLREALETMDEEE